MSSLAQTLKFDLCLVLVLTVLRTTTLLPPGVIPRSKSIASMQCLWLAKGGGDRVTPKYAFSPIPLEVTPGTSTQQNE
jgi:hypothetical protein